MTVVLPCAVHGVKQPGQMILETEVQVFPSLGASFVSVVVAFSFFDPSITPGD